MLTFVHDVRRVNAGFVVVGSGPAGLAAARAFREHGGQGPVLLISRDRHPPYARPPLSKDFLRGDLAQDELDLEDESFYADRDIELLLGQEVTDLDVRAHVVTCSDGLSISYDACLLATGGTPSQPEVPGIESAALLRSRSHARALVTDVVSAQSVVVVGSGFIGCEAAASLAMRGLAVTQVSREPAPQAARLGDEVAALIGGWLDELEVRFVAGRGLAALEGMGTIVLLDDGQRIQADLVLVAAGMTPEVHLAAGAGIEVEQGRIKVDALMRTSAADVWAAGDVVRAYNDAAGRSLTVEHWGEAERMGEIAGSGAAGDEQRWAQVPGFWTQIGDRTLKYAAWGDGYDQVVLEESSDGSFTAWYGSGDVVVGVLTHERDDDYERGQRLVEERAPWPPE